jgi:hypothetical protein
MVLKELASDCWSQLASSQGFHPEAEMACWYSGCCCCYYGLDRRRARWCGRQWLGHRGRSVGVEHRQKWRVASNDGAHVLEVLVQPPKDVEDEDLVFNGCAKVSQTIGHYLELAQYSLIKRSP